MRIHVTVTTYILLSSVFVFLVLLCYKQAILL